MHRLNRTEYANSVRDLLALDVDASTLLPPDDESYGFDNNADVLGVSPVLLERYVSASRKVSRLAVGDITQDAVAQTYRARPDLSQDKRVEGLPLGTRGGLLMHYNFPLDGKYIVKVVLARNTVDVIRGLEEAHQIEILVDGARVFLASVGGTSDTEALVKNPAEARMMIESRLQARVPVKAGPRTVAVTFLQKDAAEDDYILEPFLRTTLDPVNEAGLPHIDQVVIAGPVQRHRPGRHAQPPQDFRLPARELERRSRLRQEDSHDAGARGLSTAHHSGGHRDAAELLPSRPESRRQFRRRHRARAAVDSVQPRVCVPLRARSRDRRRGRVLSH